LSYRGKCWVPDPPGGPAADHLSARYATPMPLPHMRAESIWRTPGRGEGTTVWRLLPGGAIGTLSRTGSGQVPQPATRPAQRRRSGGTGTRSPHRLPLGRQPSVAGQVPAGTPPTPPPTAPPEPAAGRSR